MPKATSIVLFDIDGTLIRRAGAHHKDALIKGIHEITGLSTTLEGVSTHGMLDGDLIVNMLLAAGHPEEHVHANLRAIMAEGQRHYLSSCADDLTQNVCPGVTELLAELKRREAALGLVTGNLSQIGWKKMELAGLRDYFSFGAFAEDGGTRTDLARMAAQHALQAELADPGSRITLIGDHPNDIQAAKSNGFQAIGVATGLSTLEELEAANPDAAVRTLHEVEIGRLLSHA